MVGCGAPQSAATPTLDHSGPSAERLHELALRDARAEAAGLRTAIATVRIAAAKQEADLGDMRRQVGDLQQALLAKQQDLATLRHERDGLLQAKADIQAHVVGLPDARPILNETTRADTLTTSRLSRLESAVQTLSGSLDQIQKNLTKLQTRGTTRPKPKPMVLAEPSRGRP